MICREKKCPLITGGGGGVFLCHHVRWVDWVRMAWCQDSPVLGYVCGSGLKGLHPFLLSFTNKLWKPGAVAEPCTHSALSWLCPGRGCLWPAELMGSWLGPWGQAAFLPGDPVFLFQLQALAGRCLSASPSTCPVRLAWPGREQPKLWSQGALLQDLSLPFKSAGGLGGGGMWLPF